MNDCTPVPPRPSPERGGPRRGGLPGALCAGALFLAGPLGLSPAAFAAESGVVVYSSGNCLVIETAEGHTLFERSGGESPPAGSRLQGTLHDYGYQQLYDESGRELLVGYVQYWGVDDGPEMETFKRDCR